MTIAVHDIDLDNHGAGVWRQARRGMRPAKALLRAFASQVEAVATPVGAFALRKVAGSMHTLLGSAFGDEVDELAALLGVDASEVVLANLAYDLSHAAACSTFVAARPGGPLHARNLDWSFPGTLLRKHTCVVRARNHPVGDYASVTWPGLFGVLTGIAPGRFAVTVNWVAHNTESDWKGVAWRAAQGYMPVSWAVRRAFDTAADFEEAVTQLKSIALVAPVLFTVSGVKRGEGVVIERSAETAKVRKIEDGAVCVTNHYVTGKLGRSNRDLEGMDTEPRLGHLEGNVATVSDGASALRLLSSKVLLRDDTQHQVAMRAKDGLLVVRVPGERAKTVAW
jgi:hypothetical protein